MLKTISFFGGALLACSAQAQMAVDFEWRLEHRCSKTSPILLVTDLPTGTVKLAANMVDNDMTSYVHGGGLVDVPSQTNFEIESGALKSYIGPCPPNFSSFGHEYSWTVKALNAAGAVLATATNAKTFSSAKVAK